MNKDDLVEAVHTELNRLFDGPRPEDWTRDVKTALCNACVECVPNASVYATHVDAAKGGEWMYDLTCLRYDRDGHLVRIPLVAECEWGNRGDICDDFEKLLLARADVCVMVFEGGRFAEGENKFEMFARYIGRCEVTEPGDTYLLAAWHPDRFEYCRIDAFQAQHILGNGKPN